MRERAWADAWPCGRRLTGKLLAIFCAVLPHFCRSLAAVAGVTKGLVVLGFDEQSPRTTVGLNVIHIRCPDPQALPRALSAEGLPEKLIRPKLVFPDRQAIPPVPVRSLGTSPGYVLRLMLGTVALPCQHATARMGTETDWLLRHRITSGEKQKEPEPNPHLLGGSAQALRLRLFSILTTDSVRQDLHHTTMFLPSVPGRIFRTLCRLQRGHRRNPSFVSILPHFI